MTGASASKPIGKIAPSKKRSPAYSASQFGGFAIGIKAASMMSLPVPRRLAS